MNLRIERRTPVRHDGGSADAELCAEPEFGVPIGGRRGERISLAPKKNAGVRGKKPLHRAMCPACGQPENRYATVNGPSNKVRLMTSVFAWCGPCFTPFGAKKNAPVV